MCKICKVCNFIINRKTQHTHKRQHQWKIKKHQKKCNHSCISTQFWIKARQTLYKPRNKSTTHMTQIKKNSQTDSNKQIANLKTKAAKRRIIKEDCKTEVKSFKTISNKPPRILSINRKYKEITSTCLQTNRHVQSYISISQNKIDFNRLSRQVHIYLFRIRTL